MEFKERVLGAEALEWVRYALRTGLVSLSEYLLQEVNLDKGKVKTYMPDTIPYEQAVAFRLGFKHEIHNGEKYFIHMRENNEVHVINLITDFLTKHKCGICVFEDNIFDADDIEEYVYAGNFRVNAAFLEQEVYYYLLSEDKDNPDLIDKTITEADQIAPVTTGILSVLPRDDYHKIRRDLLEHCIGRESLILLSKNVKKLITGAYDAEGF